jgi:hypothetical protein
MNKTTKVRMEHVTRSMSDAATSWLVRNTSAGRLPRPCEEGLAISSIVGDCEEPQATRQPPDYRSLFNHSIASLSVHEEEDWRI